MLRVAIIIAVAVVVGFAAESALGQGLRAYAGMANSARVDGERRTAAAWLAARDFLATNETRLLVEDWLDQNGIQYAKDASIMEIHAAVDVTEQRGRPVVEKLCEVYPDAAGWTVYVNHPEDGGFIFATTCPSRG